MTQQTMCSCIARSCDDSSTFSIRVEEFYKNATLASSSSQAAGALHIHNSFLQDREPRCTNYFSDPVTCLDILKHGALIHNLGDYTRNP